MTQPLTVLQSEETLTVPTPAVAVEDLWFAYREGSWILRGVDLQIPMGGFWAIMGPSGAGKTTLMRILAGLLPFPRGRVLLLGHPVRGELEPALRRSVGYIPQQLGLVRGLTALENVLLGSLARHRGWQTALGFFPRAEIERAMALLEVLDLADRADEKVFRLSGGERQRVAIARTLMQDPQLILADEFVSDLDLPRAAHVLAFVYRLARERGLTVILNLHELQLVQEFAEHVVILKDGRVVFESPALDLTWPLFREIMGDYEREALK
ncbi:phosphonate ABC transporter ATP-binding protein [Thermoflexus sp.]|uniref:phosphonate ABC transporter ATP-binding protein n=1 Tax=Thermoflexus sp. TaxID=1969742 RepID=UPI0025CFAF1A|nr:ATP-binding cassette domain-containing protein [Thermoflexus sp.]MCS6962815.1 ATP-binding cassette domain-containing protein [Thermoflexus sp.]MDW8064356.1 ATP-binding cassette domain-containing protein [Anaerolineae bacterium]MDW8185632.1 ATP-binding cassette domain-containing protein [Anaerolineae bacterium]